MQIPFLDLKIQYKQIENEVLPMITAAMENGQFVGGSHVVEFEKEFAKFCESDYAIGVNSGTDALRFALMALNIGPGDEVITVPNTFIATTEAISQTGARPVFVDIDPHTCNMDPNKLEDYLKVRCCVLKSAKKSDFNPRTLSPDSGFRPKAIIPVHLYGQVADMDSIMEIAHRFDLVVIEDACQAHGATYKGREAGAIGAAGCFSFYPGKNLGAFGEGGAVVTCAENVAEKIKMIRDHGQSQKYYHDMEGYNGRLDAIQAGVLRIKLKRLKDWNMARRNNARYYDELLSKIPGVGLTTEADYGHSVYHLYVIQVEGRDGLRKYLGERGIATALHYPMPLHLQKAYAHMGLTRGSFPVTEEIADRLLSLPMYAELTKEQIEYVVESIKEFIELK